MPTLTRPPAPSPLPDRTGKRARAAAASARDLKVNGVSSTATLAQTTTDLLRRALLDGGFAPQERLQEESLCTLLKVSRTPVRSALHSLAAEGLLDYVPNRGYSVRRVDPERLDSSFDLRGVLEGLAARKAAEHGMDASVLAICDIALAEGDRVIAKGRLLASDRSVFIEVNATIHQAIVCVAADRMLGDMLRLCHNIPVSSHRNVSWDDYPWLRRSHDDHHRIVEAIRLRDGARAETLMREHVHSVKLSMRSRLIMHASGLTPPTAEVHDGPGRSGRRSALRTPKRS